MLFLPVCSLLHSFSACKWYSTVCGINESKYVSIINPLFYLQLTLHGISIDVLYHSWELLRALVKDEKFKETKQLIIRVYTKEGHNETSKIKDYLLYQDTLNLLHQLGFLKWKSHACKLSWYKSTYTGQWRSWCWEMMYINNMYMS